MYFRLHSHCKLVTGARRGAIYNLETGKVLSINQGAVELLKACGTDSVENIFDSSAADNQPYVSFLQELAEKELGSIFFKEPSRAAIRTSPTPPKLEFLWLELTGACNNTCLHCYAASGPCKAQEDIASEHWLRIISEARALGASAIQFIGGEPLMYAGWRELIAKAAREGYAYIEVFTNATTITDEDIVFFKDNGVRIATTLYADNAAVHDKVTLHPGSFAKTMENVRKILAAGVPLRIASIIMKANQDQADNIMNLCAELGVEVNPPDVVRPTGRGDDQDILPESYKRAPIKPPFFTNEESFNKARCYHSCLAGKLAVTSSGQVIPCIFARSHSFGNILVNSLTEIVESEALTTCWQTTKDDIEKCKDCEYRYACEDCRPLAEGADPDTRWLACSAGCEYNPYTGKWGD